MVSELSILVMADDVAMLSEEDLTQLREGFARLESKFENSLERLRTEIRDDLESVHARLTQMSDQMLVRMDEIAAVTKVSEIMKTDLSDEKHFIHSLEKLPIMKNMDQTVVDSEFVKLSSIESTSFKLVEKIKGLNELETKSHSVKDFVVVFEDSAKKNDIYGVDWEIVWLQWDFDICLRKFLDTGQASRILKLESNSFYYEEVPHVATHILRGAFDCLRLDFNYGHACTDTQLEEIERLTNGWNEATTILSTKMMPLKEAKEACVIAMFREKYGKQVRVIEVLGVFRERCGGTLNNNTSEVNVFKMITEQEIASGVMRIEAVAGESFIEYITVRDSQKEFMLHTHVSTR